MQVSLDGKAARGARDAAGNRVRLFAALVGSDAAASVVAAQAELGKNANEVPMAAAPIAHTVTHNSQGRALSNSRLPEDPPRSCPARVRPPPPSPRFTANASRAAEAWPRRMLDSSIRPRATGLDPGRFARLLCFAGSRWFPVHRV